MLERPVDLAIRRVKDEPPAQRGERGRGHEGNEHRATEETLPPGGTLQKQGQTQAKDTFEHYRRDGKNNCVAYGLEENVILQDIDKILQANPAPRFTNHPIAETEPESQEKRIDDKRCHDDGRRQDKAIPIEVRPQSPTPPPSYGFGGAHVDEHAVTGFRNRHPTPLYTAHRRWCMAECGRYFPQCTIRQPLPFHIALVNTLHLAFGVLHRLLGRLLPRGTGRYCVWDDELVPHHFCGRCRTSRPARRVRIPRDVGMKVILGTRRIDRMDSETPEDRLIIALTAYD